MCTHPLKIEARQGFTDNQASVNNSLLLGTGRDVKHIVGYTQPHKDHTAANHHTQMHRVQHVDHHRMDPNSQFTPKQWVAMHNFRLIPPPPEM